MKRVLTISPREGLAPCAASSATSGTGSSCHFAAATSTKRKFDDANYDKEKRKITFQDQWFGEISWLSYTKNFKWILIRNSIRNDTMACNVWRKFTRSSDPMSALVLGTDILRKYPLYKREKRAHATLPASISSATSTAKESLGMPLQTAIGLWYLGST